MMKSTQIVLVTKGEVVKAETVGGREIRVVEFFDMDAFADEGDTIEGDGITIDVPFETWNQMACPTEITVTVERGNTLHDDSFAGVPVDDNAR